MDADLQFLAALSLWAYALVLVVAAVDAIVPVVPSETVVILGGVLAAQGRLNPWVLFTVAAVGATMGDNASYSLGRGANRRGRTAEQHGGRTGRALRWANRLLRARGASVLIVARFVPGGRTATTFASGYLRFPRGRFLAAVAAGGLLWAAYATAIGYLGGTVFHDNTLAGVAAGLGIAVAVALVIEVVRARRPALRTAEV